MSTEVDGKRYYVTSWMDSKPVNFLSPFKPNKFFVMRTLKVAGGGWRETPVPCPTLAPVYNKEMKGTDLNDQKGAMYDSRRRCQTRWQPRCERREMKTALINANVLFNHGKGESKQMPLLPFTKAVILQLSGWRLGAGSLLRREPIANSEDDNDDYEDDEPTEKKRRTAYTWQKDVSTRTLGQHFLQQMKAGKSNHGIYSNPRGKCIVCKNFTPFLCQQCKVHVCIMGSRGNLDCWADFHDCRNFGAKKHKLKKNTPVEPVR
jgi:hypothetical protein